MVGGGMGVNNNPQIPHHALRPLEGGVHDMDGLHQDNNNDMGDTDPGR